MKAFSGSKVNEIYKNSPGKNIIRSPGAKKFIGAKLKAVEGIDSLVEYLQNLKQHDIA